MRRISTFVQTVWDTFNFSQLTKSSFKDIEPVRSKKRMISKKKTDAQQAVAADQLNCVKNVQEKLENMPVPTQDQRPESEKVMLRQDAPDGTTSEKNSEEKVGKEKSPDSTDDDVVEEENPVEVAVEKGDVDEVKTVESSSTEDSLTKEPKNDSEMESEKEHPKKLSGKASLPIFKKVIKCPVETCHAEKESVVDEANAEDEAIENKRGEKRKSV